MEEDRRPTVEDSATVWEDSMLVEEDGMLTQEGGAPAQEGLAARRSRGYGTAMRVGLVRFVLAWLFVLALAPPVLGAGRKEIHVSVRPRSVPENVDRWAYYPGTGLTLFGDGKEFERATNELIVFVYDKDASAESVQNNCTLKQMAEARGDAVRPDPHQPEGGLSRCGGAGRGSEGPKRWDAAAAQALARAGAAASLSSPAGEKGGSPRGVAGGMNPDADPPPGVQAAVAAVQIALSVTEIKQIVRNATRFIAARATKQAEVEAIEKAAEEAIAQLQREGKAVSREAIEARAREAAEEAERSLHAGGQAGRAPGSAPTVVHVRGGRKPPPPIGQSGTPIRSGLSTPHQPPQGAALTARGETQAFSKEKQALVDMAKADKQAGGITRGDMKAYKELNKGLPDPFPEDQVRGPEMHRLRTPASKPGAGQQPHGHVGPVDHIPIKDQP